MSQRAMKPDVAATERAIFPGVILLVAILGMAKLVGGSSQAPHFVATQADLARSPWYVLASLEGVGPTRARELQRFVRLLPPSAHASALALPGVSAILRSKWQDELAPATNSAQIPSHDPPSPTK